MKKLFNLSALATAGLMMSAITASAQAPTVTTDPSATSACNGAIATFSVVVTGATSYNWQESPNGTTWTTLADGGMYAGATTPTLSISAATAVNGYYYRAIAINTDGEDTSATAMLTVNALPVGGTISGPNRVCIGSSVSLAATTGGGIWSSSLTGLSTVDGSGNVFGVAAGWDTIRYTITTPTCGDTTTTYMVRIDAPMTSSPILGSNAVCVGGSITLSNAAGAGVWSASNGNATIGAGTGMVTGVTAGRDTITYDFSNACGSFSVETEINVETPLTVGTISGPEGVCVGSTAIFSATGPDGTWVSSDATIASVDLPGTITGRSQGTANISYVVSNSCGSSSTSVYLRVDRTASIITGPDSVGVGALITLTDSASSGSWSSSDTTITIVFSDGVVNGVAPGTVIITYTVTNECGTTTATKTIEVGDAPSAGAIAGPDSICVGATVTLSASITGGVWTASNGAATIDASGLVTAITGGTYDTFSYSVTNGFGTTTVRKAIYINQAPVISITGPASISLLTGYTLTATPTGGTWVSTNTTNVIFISANTFVVMKRGVTDLIYTVSNTCGTSTDTFVVNLPVISGVNEVSTSSAINVFPNPNNGSFNLNIATANNETADITITNVVGGVVSEAKVETNKTNNITINQPAGVYFVTATTQTDKYTTRVVITK